jgi:hypothetical protein
MAANVHHDEVELKGVEAYLLYEQMGMVAEIKCKSTQHRNTHFMRFVCEAPNNHVTRFSGRNVSPGHTQ